MSQPVTSADKCEAAPAPALAPGPTQRYQSLAERFLVMLKRKGVDHLFVNAGTDTAPIVEAYARQPESGLDFPEPMIGAHENLVVGMAHGYTMVTGRPQAVMVHVTVGAANAVCGIMNARRDEMPMLFMAGRTPLYEKGPAGARNGAIHWAQEMYDQGGMLRELVKWDYELRSGVNAEEIVDRALTLTRASPCGPVYLTLPREVLVAEAELQDEPRAAQPTPAPAAPDPAALSQLARMIAAARCPVLVTSASGRDPATVTPLAALCERFGIGIVEAKSRYVCAPSSHPFHLGQTTAPAFAAADLLICMDSEVPWLPNQAEPNAGTKVVHVAPDPLFGDYPVRSFRSDLSITSSNANFLAALGPALDAVVTEAGGAARREAVGALAAQLRSRRSARLARIEAARRMTKDWMSRCLQEALPTGALIVNEYWVDREIYRTEEPGGFFMHSPAAGLGWGLPAAIGAAKAAPERLVVCATGDGAYLFSNPAACHQAIAMHRLPLLTIVCNNARWGAVHASTLGVYPGGHTANSSTPSPFSDLDPAPDFERYVEASGGYGERVTDPLALVEAIGRGARIVREDRRQVLLNVICE